jgi:hypothetical protein
MCPLDIPFDRIGAHGIGEIGIIAAGATISNAVFHASAGEPTNCLSPPRIERLILESDLLTLQFLSLPQEATYATHGSRKYIVVVERKSDIKSK